MHNHSTYSVNDPEIPLLSDINNKIEKATIIKLNKRIVPITVITPLILYIIRDASSFLANGICQSLHLTYSEYGLGISLYTIAYALFVGIGSMMLSKFKISMVTAIIPFASGLSSILFAFIQNKYHYYILRFTMGILQTGLMPVILNYISSMFPKKYSLFAYSLITSTIQFSRPFAATFAMIFLILGNNWLLGLSAWRCLFLIVGIFNCCFFVVPFLLLPNNPYDFKKLSFAERNWLINALENQNTEIKEKAEFKVSLYRLIRNRKTWIISLSEALRAMCFLGLFSFITLITSEMLDDEPNNQDSAYNGTCADNSNSALASILASIPFIFAGIGSILVGKYGNYIKNLALYICFTQLLASIFIILWIFIQNYPIIGIIVLTLVNIFGNTNYSLKIKMLENTVDEEDKLLAFSLFLTVGLGGAMLGPILIGIIVDFYGFNGGMIYMIVSLWISSFLIIFSV